MNNIFEKAYFGKPYKTKNNTIVKFVLQDKDFIILYIPKCKYSIETTHRYNSKGEFYLGEGEFGHSALDIISEWQEPIDEEELDKLAINYLQDKEGEIIRNPLLYEVKDCIESYKAGYRKGWEDKK